MQKLILDTNVIVSALISNSIPTLILYDLVLVGKVGVYLSEAILEEYIGVLCREKFSKFPNFKSNSNVVLNKLREISIFYTITEKVEILSDASDDKFLELAASSSADYLITGNTADFPIKEFEYTRIVTPREYWDHFKPTIK
jgi:uncharacterized protein